MNSWEIKKRDSWNSSGTLTKALSKTVREERSCYKCIKKRRPQLNLKGISHRESKWRQKEMWLKKLAHTPSGFFYCGCLLGTRYCLITKGNYRRRYSGGCSQIKGLPSCLALHCSYWLAGSSKSQLLMYCTLYLDGRLSIMGCLLSCSISCSK